MKIVNVRYTVSAAYAAQNRNNILGVVTELKKLAHPGIRYSAYLLDDGKTFLHFDHLRDEAAHQFLQELQSFKKFASELWASEMEVKPKLELLHLVSSTEEFFPKSEFVG